jgi:quercetin dioxygenase-like cupin family protein
MQMLKIRINKASGTVLAIFATVFFINTQTILAQEKPTINRTVLLENKVDLPSKNINAKIIRVTFPPAFKTPRHTHGGPGPRYVVKGKLKVVEVGKTNTYSTGEVFWESGNLMSVENISENAAELIIFELAPAK